VVRSPVTSIAGTVPARGRKRREGDELGAHVSTAGGVQNAPGRAEQIGSACLQLFTKQPSRWAESDVGDELAAAFAAERARAGVRVAGSHDAYLINLASPDPVLWARSLGSFTAELERCTRLGLDFLVSHPGNAVDGDYASGILRNAEGIARAIETVDSVSAERGDPSTRPRILLELTAGGGTSVGGTFEELARIIEAIPSAYRYRIGVCVDTCHAWSAGYDLEGDYEGVWGRFDDLIGLERLGLFHFNDSKTPFASHNDRHEHIGKGSLGPEPFRKILLDERFTDIPKLLETPKDKDAVKADKRNLRVLRKLRREGLGANARG
jgi:deoxyribonuclease IV